MKRLYRELGDSIFELSFFRKGLLRPKFSAQPVKRALEREFSDIAHRELIPETIHITHQYENNRAEHSDEATRVRERGMRKFKSVKQAQRFLRAHAAVIYSTLEGI